MADTSSAERWNDLPSALIPQRMSFVPGTDRKEFEVTYRELEARDSLQVARVVQHVRGKRPTAAWMQKFYATTGKTGYIGRGVFRNRMTLIGMSLSSHVLDAMTREDVKTERSVLQILWVHPDYFDTKVPLRLLQLARLELPEYPTMCRVSGTTEQYRAFLATAGWTEVNDGEYHAPSVARREHRAACEVSRPTRQPPAVGDAG